MQVKFIPLLLSLLCSLALSKSTCAQSATWQLSLEHGVHIDVPSDAAAQAPAWVMKIVSKLKHGKKDGSLKEHPRLVAIALTVLLGPFGAHRIYLGTREIVPVFYTLTLGGGVGIVPFIDLLHLIFTKDLSKFVNNPKVLMW